MKILIVGSQKTWAIEKFYIKELSISHDVDIFEAHGIFLDYYHKNIFHKLLYRLNISPILKKINRDLLSQCLKKHYDLIWVFKGMEIFPKTLKKLKSLGSTLINYNGDHPFEHFSRGSGNKNVIKGFPLYDHHFTYSKQILKEIQKRSSVPVTWLPFGHSIAQLPCPKHDSQSLCFIGNPDKERVRLIKTLSKERIPIYLYGNNWKTHLQETKSLKIYPAIYKDDFVKITQKHRLQLNIFRAHNNNSHNMRTFEMPALGSIMLAPFSEEHRELFEENKEAFFYQNDRECIEKTKAILQFNQDDAYKIKLAAYQRSTSSSYSYKDRAKIVLKTVSEHKNV